MKHYVHLLLLTICVISPLHAKDNVPWLRAEGSCIVDEQGTPVVLRGVNLGGWLVEEMWMMPFKTDPPKKSYFQPIVDHVSLWKVLNSRFKKKEIEQLLTELRQAWLQESLRSQLCASAFSLRSTRRANRFV